MSFDVYSYRLGKRSAERLVRALRKALCGSEDESCGELPELAPYLMGSGDCLDLEAALDLYFSWEGLAWAYEPRGRPPDHKKELVKRILCRHGLPLDEEFLEALSRPGEPMEGTGEEAE